MKYIYLRSSDIAKLTGHNKYETLEKTVNELLSRNGIQDRYVPKGQLVSLSNEQLSLLKQELHVSEHATLQDIESMIKSTVMCNSYSGILTEEESKQNIDTKLEGKPILQCLESGIKQDLQMKRGNIKENSNLNVIQSKNKIVIDKRNSKMYTKELYRNDTYCLVIRGKIDGLNGDTIIESKNRTKYLFKELRGYEQVQLECYMFLTGFKNAILTEHYNSESNCIHYTHDKTFWNVCQHNIITFIDTNIAIYLD
jgi:hypothetical protein